MDVDQLMLDFYGVETYHTIEDPWGNYHEHVDCWAKFLSHEKIIISQVPSTHYNYTTIENVVTYFENQLNSYGEPYEIYRVYCPNGEPYANSYIMNGKVYVPINNGPYDENAIASFQEASTQAHAYDSEHVFALRRRWISWLTSNCSQRCNNSIDQQKLSSCLASSGAMADLPQRARGRGDKAECRTRNFFI